MHTKQFQDFRDVVNRQVAIFRETQVARLIDNEEFTIQHYHTLLLTIFHQTYSSPYTFAKAAVHCPWQHEAAKEYLLTHAAEEMTHWRWVISDLQATGYTGPDPRELMPRPACQAFIGLNHYVAEQAPVARLAIASVLEGIGCEFGSTYGAKAIKQLGLRPDQASFYLQHGETDKVHSVDLESLISSLQMSDREWDWMTYAAGAGGALYRDMYGNQ